MKTIPIKTNNKRFFRQFLELMKFTSPFNKIRPKELDTLAEILFQLNEYKEIPLQKRYIIVFSTETRKEMMNNLGINQDLFNNTLSGLRKVNILSKDNKLIPFLQNIVFDREFKLTFSFVDNG